MRSHRWFQYHGTIFQRLQMEVSLMGTIPITQYPFPRFTSHDKIAPRLEKALDYDPADEGSG